jgi:hypothetical protein
MKLAPHTLLKKEREMRELTLCEVELVDGGSFGGAMAAGGAGASAAATIAWLAGAPTGGVGAAAVVVGGFLGGVALYYLTD